MARYERTEHLIELVLALQVPGPGLTLDDIEARFGVGRRTAERMLKAVERIYPDLGATKGPDGRKHWRLPPGHANALVHWTGEELDAVSQALEQARTSGQTGRAAALASVQDKLRGLSAAAPGVVDPDASAEPGDEAERARFPSPEQLAVLREAIASSRRVRLGYRHGGEVLHRTVDPYGFLEGREGWLVVWSPRHPRPSLLALDHVVEVERAGEFFEREPLYDLRRFAANAFAKFQEEPANVVWRFRPEVAHEAREYAFHPDQTLEERPDGSLVVRFRASGLVEMAWHLFTWGDQVQIVEPPVLKESFNEMLQKATRALDREAPDETRRPPRSISVVD